MESQTIKTVCHEIRKESLKGTDRQNILQKFSEFQRCYPKLFEACLNNEFQLDHLEYMLNMKNQLIAI